MVYRKTWDSVINQRVVFWPNHIVNPRKFPLWDWDGDEGSRARVEGGKGGRGGGRGRRWREGRRQERGREECKDAAPRRTAGGAGPRGRRVSTPPPFHAYRNRTSLPRVDVPRARVGVHMSCAIWKNHSGRLSRYLVWCDPSGAIDVAAPARIGHVYWFATSLRESWIGSSTYGVTTRPPRPFYTITVRATPPRVYDRVRVPK